MGTVIQLKKQINNSYTDLKSSVEDKLILVEEKINSRLASKVELVQKMTKYHLSTGGKRLRALLTLQCSKICGYEKGLRDVNLAACVELIHAATLMHDDVIDNSKIRSGNVIVGLASFGKTNYEEEYNSGIGSNGLTSARHDVFQKYLKEKYPETYDNSLDDSLVYTGSKKLTDKIEGYDHDIGKLVLSPTRTYAPVVKEIISKVGVSNIDGMIHCSGGAQTKVLHFVENKHIIKDNLFNTPIIFDLIQNESKTSWKEMYQVFNMGHRLEIYTDKLSAQKIIDISASFDLEAKIIGRVEDSISNKLSISGDKGNFEY